MSFTIRDGRLQPPDFIRLFEDAGWGTLPLDVVAIVLENSWATFTVESGGPVIAMARLLGDGAMSFFLKDVVVEHAHRGQGVGRLLIAHIEAYIRQRLHPGCEGYLQLVSAKGCEGFYRQLGYALHPHEHSGAGMSKWLSPMRKEDNACSGS